MSAGWRSVRPMRRRSEHKVVGRDVRGRTLTRCIGPKHHLGPRFRYRGLLSCRMNEIAINSQISLTRTLLSCRGLPSSLTAHYSAICRGIFSN